MSHTIHGISVGIERHHQQMMVVMKASGTLTHEDYQNITPMLIGAFQAIEQPKIKILVDITDFDGWELRAAWDDFRLGLELGTDIDKIAIYGHKSWQDMAAKIGAWFIKGEMRAFEQYQDAIDWISSSESE